jgi:hypothetical protein
VVPQQGETGAPAPARQSMLSPGVVALSSDAAV